MAERTCSGGGWLVGMDEKLPSALGDYYPEGGTFCGCNRLKCSKCGAWVRHFDNVRLEATTLGTADCAKLFAGADPPAFERSYRDTSSRAYVCKCSFEQTRGGRSSEAIDAPWSCGGHPGS